MILRHIFGLCLTGTLIIHAQDVPPQEPKPADTQATQGRDRLAASSTPITTVHWKHSPFENAPYFPMDLKLKAYVFGYRNVEPTALGKSLVTASIAHLSNSPEEWGQGSLGLARRYGHRLATRGVETTIGFGVAAALHQDPRYFRLSEGGVFRRIGHAVSYSFITRTDQGGKTFSAWRMAGNYGSQFVSNAWRPVDKTAGDALVRGTISVGYDMAANVFKEVWPDVRRKIFKR